MPLLGVNAVSPWMILQLVMCSSAKNAKLQVLWLGSIQLNSAISTNDVAAVNSNWQNLNTVLFSGSPIVSGSCGCILHVVCQ